jgi:hypothetical protein
MGVPSSSATVLLSMHWLLIYAGVVLLTGDITAAGQRWHLLL